MAAEIPTTTDPSPPALREAQEETGLDPAGVQLLRVLPGIYVPPSKFDVTTVVAYWRTPSPVRVVDAQEAGEWSACPYAPSSTPRTGSS